MDRESSQASKHLGMGDRQRRFDPRSKYGGRGGHTLVRARPAAHISLDGYDDICVTVGPARPGRARRPLAADGTSLAPSGLDHVVRDESRFKDEQCELSGTRALQFAKELEATCAERTVERDADCPDIIVTKYKVGDVVYRVTSLDAAANIRRFPRGFDQCHLGCSICGKNRGTCRQLGSTKVRRHRFHQELGKDASIALADSDEGGAHADAFEPELDCRVQDSRRLFGARDNEELNQISTPLSRSASSASVEESEASWIVVTPPTVCLEGSGV